MRFEEAVSEDIRQSVHIAMGGFALALPYLPWWQSVFLACAAVVFNIFAIQKVLGMAVFRPGERLRRLTSGIVLYPLCVLGLLVVFADRIDIVAGAWGVLAAGDGMATIVGRRMPLRRIPWNPRKSLGGTLSLFLFGGAAAAALAWWCRALVVPPAYAWFPFVGGFAAAAVAAAVETIPVSLDDNVSVAASSAAVLWAISLVSEDLLVAASAALWYLPIALFVNVFVAAVGYRAGTVTVSGVAGGALLGTVIMVCAGWQGWLLLFATFAAAVVSSRTGLRRKMLLGIAEERGGRRGAGNAFANTGVAAVAALMSLLTYAQDPALLAFVTALAAGGSDTVASEIGKAFGRRTFLVTTASRVPPGTPGAMSLEGTIAGVLAAAALALIGASLGLIPFALVLVVVIGATAGALVESILGATLEPIGVLNNDLLNFVNTAVAALVAVQVARLA